MGWPVATHATDDLINAAIWNADLVANMNAIMHPIVRKGSDESVVSSVTFQDDDALLMPVLANEIWRFEFEIITTGLFDFQGRLAFPSGRIDGGAIATNSSGVIALTNLGSAASPSTLWLARADSATVPRTHWVRGLFANGGSAGNLQLQWAQGVSGATATIVKTNSTVWGAKLS
jgi:hypothetical protein